MCYIVLSCLDKKRRYFNLLSVFVFGWVKDILMQNMRRPESTPLVGAQGYQRFALSKHVVGRNIALDTGWLGVSIM